MLKRLFVIPFFLLLYVGAAVPCAAMPPKGDSIRNVLQLGKHDDSTQVLLLLLLANEFEGIDADTMNSLGIRALQLASTINFERGISNANEIIGASYSMKGKNDSALYYYRLSLDYAIAHNLNRTVASKYNHIANVYFLTGKYPDANTYYDSAITTARENGDKELEAKALSNLAGVYYKMGNYSRALNNYLQGLKIQERLGLMDNIATDVSNIANVYYRLGMYTKAIAFTDRAMALHRKSGIKERMVGSLTTYALIYNDRKMYDSALYYLNQGLKLAEEMQSPFLQNILIGNIAEAQLKKGDFTKAADLYSQSIKMSEKLDDAEGLAFAKAGLGAVYLKQEKTHEGRILLQDALQMMNQLSIREQALDIASKLAQSYESTSDFKNAYKYLNIENAIADSLKKEKAREEVKQLIFNYEIEKKENEIRLLQKDNAIIESTNRYQKILLWTFLCAFIVTSIVAYLVYRNMQQVRKSRKLIEQQAKKLAELNDFKDNTFSVLAHDLRSPVNALTSTMMLLDEEIISPAEFVTYKQELNNKLQSVSILLDNMLHWAKSQMKGEHTLEIERLNIKRKILKTISVLGDAAKQKNININSDVPAEVWAWGDKDHIDIIIRNLVSNAIKFTKDGGDISISAHSVGTVTSIAIADNGVGMSAEQVSRLFEEDAHISTKGTEGEKGTGLGMSLCYDLVKKNHGDIKVVSSLGVGSVFTIILPSA
jgi:signal transduction histidine kinase